MARSFRDRFWSPPVARAVTSPGSILLAGGIAALAVVATAPLSLPLLAVGAIGAAAGGAAYGGRVLLAVPRDGRKGPRPDPFAVQEPWRRFVSDAIDARRRFDEAMKATNKGPLHDRLSEIGSRLDDAVDEIWRIARQGNTLVGARQRVDVDGARRELAEVEDQADEPWAEGSRLQQTAEALRAQVASAERMEIVIADAVDRLRLLDARLDEAVTRAIELSTGASSLNAGVVTGDVDGIVTEMEALRLALDEATAAGRGGVTAGPGGAGATDGAPGTDPSGGLQDGSAGSTGQ